MKLCAGSFELEFAEGLGVLWPAIGKGDGFGIEAASDRIRRVSGVGTDSAMAMCGRQLLEEPMR